MHLLMTKLNMWNMLVGLGFKGSWRLSEDDIIIYERLQKELHKGDASVVSHGVLHNKSWLTKGQEEH